MSVHYVFVHGWGTDPDFWERLRPHFPKKQSHFLNLGFIGHDQRIENHKAPSDSKRVYITHSLGTLWALKNKVADIDVLIAINGFYRFKSFSDERSLQAMKLRLERDPIPQMGDFWKKCGITKDKADLNLQRLQEGMVWISKISAAKELGAYAKPVLCLCGDADPILDQDIMKKEWSGFPIKTLMGGGHIMPWSHPEWCANTIKEFVSGLKLER